MTKTAPIRTCIACHETSDKRDLVRFVRTPEGTVQLDPSGKAAGRGAYVCADDVCVSKAFEKQMLGSRLRAKVGKQDYERLKADFDAYMLARNSVKRG